MAKATKKVSPRKRAEQNGSEDSKVLTRRRLTPEKREREIVEGAVQFFAELGFEGGLRELAQRLGITHQNLFRYFPSKEALIERVYEEVYLGRWQPEWEELLHDSTQPLET